MKIYSCLVSAQVPGGFISLGKITVRAKDAAQAHRIASDLLGRDFEPGDISVEFDPMDDPEECN